jgi:hypothetical protein
VVRQSLLNLPFDVTRKDARDDERENEQHHQYDKGNKA